MGLSEHSVDYLTMVIKQYSSIYPGCLVRRDFEALQVDLTRLTPSFRNQIGIVISVTDKNVMEIPYTFAHVLWNTNHEKQ